MKIRFVFSLILLLILSSILLPKRAFADYEPLNDLWVQSENVLRKSDGTFDISLGFTYHGASAADVVTRIQFALEHRDTHTSCTYPSLTSNPSDLATNPTGKIIVTQNCDFRNAGIGTKSLSFTLKFDQLIPNDCVDFITADCKTINNLLTIENVIGAEQEQYISNVVPLGGRVYRIEMGGDNGGPENNIEGFACYVWYLQLDLCRYRIRVKGFEGSDFNSWPTAPVSYSCSGIRPTESNTLPIGVVVPQSFTCDFSNFTGSSLILALYRGGPDRLVDEGTAPISEYVVNLASDKGYIKEYSSIATATPNDFQIKVQFLPSSGFASYPLKVTNRSSGVVVSTRACSVNSNNVEDEVWVSCDFSDVNPSGSYNLTLFDALGNVIHFVPFALESYSPTAPVGTCSCDETSGVCRIRLSSNLCTFGNKAKITRCGDLTDPGCNCTCISTGVAVGPGGIPLAPLDYSLADFQSWAAKGQQYIIAFGIFSSIFIVPYFGVLLASGNSENIEKGLEWAKSWAFGLLLLLLSSFVIRIIGSDILGF